MGRKILGLCNAPWCRKRAVTQGYCDAHRKEQQRYEARQPGARTPFYDSREWRRLRAHHLASNPWCSAPDCNQPGQVVDHKVRIKQADGSINYSLALDPNNLQSLCQVHHNIKRGKERHEK